MAIFHTQVVKENMLLRCSPLLLMVFCLLLTANLSTLSFNLIQLILNDNQIVILSFLSFGFMIVFYSGEFDLSIGSIFALCLVSIGSLSNKPLPLPFIILSLLLLVVVIGYLNAYLSNKIDSLFITFIMLYILRGFVFIFTDGVPISYGQSGTILTFIGWGKIMGIRAVLILLALVTTILSVFFCRSAYAKNLIAVGLNQKKAKRLNIEPSTYKFAAFVFSGCMALFASFFYYANILTVSPNAGIVYGFESLAVVIISNGGLKRLPPSPLLVVVTTILITLIDHYCSALGLYQEVINMIIGGFVLVSIASGQLISAKL